MKIAEYNEMMAYLLRPAQEAKLVDDLEPGSLRDELLKDFDPSQETYEEYLQRKSMRENAAQGGVIGKNGMFKGQDMGTRKGFNNLSKSEASYKAYEDKFGKSILNKMAQSQYGKNFRELDKTNQLKFFKSQVNKYEDFIKLNKRYPNKSEAYRIGLEQSGQRQAFDFLGDDIREVIKNTYSSGEGGSPYIANKLSKPPYNFKIDGSTIRRFITAEEEAGNIVRPKKFKTQEADLDLPKDRYNIIREVTDRDLRGFKVGRTQTEVLAPKGSKYKITFNVPRSTETTKIPSAYQGTQYYKTKAQADKAIAGSKKFSKDLIKQGKANKGLREIILEEISDPNIEAEIGRMKTFEDLATAHRASYKQVKKLGELYNILNLGVEDPGINSGAIRKFENKLDNLYKEQNNLIRTARRSTNKGLEIPKNIQKRIDDVNKEISAVVDLTNQRVQGILVDAKTLKPYTYGVNYIKTYGMGFLDNKPVQDITDEDLKVIEDNMKFQIAREKKLGKGTESFLRDRQPLLKYTKELSEPGFLSKIPAKLRPIALATGITIGGISAASAADGTTEQGFSTGEKLAGAGVAGGAYAARKPILKTLGKIARPFGFPAVAAGFALNELTGEDPNLGIAGAELLAPELIKKGASTGTGIMSKIGRVAANPFGKLARGFTPVGLGLMGIEGVRMGMEEQDRINEMRMNEPDKYEEYLDELESYGDFSA
tara:strand:+ start:718 stop:2850 length:2133 start_codon:yes stop_codon:yes gene_type:complete